MANQVDFKILPSDQFNVYSPQTRSDKIITYFTLLSKLRGDILAVGAEDDPNDIVSAFYTNTGGTQTLHLVKADGSEITASQAQQVISGTLNYVSKFTSSNDIGNSQIFDDGTNVGIGTTTMNHKLELGTGGVFADYFQLDTTYSNGFVVGAISWDSDNGTADIGLSDSLKLKIGQDDVWYVKNQTGSPIAKGTAVYASGTLGASSKILITPMIANGTIPARFFLGIVAETIANGAEGYVLAKGKIRNINTNAYNEGDVLWVSPTTAGALTSTEPTAPNLKLPVAFVVNKGNNGVLAVRATTGTRIADASDVDYSGAADNSFLVYDLASGVWVDEAVGIFKTIAVDGQSDVVADAYDDTLTLVAGTNVTITTNASTDTITINSTDEFVGTVTSVATTAPITGGTITTTGTIGITQSGAASDGYLSSVDWNTFNSKEPALTKGDLTEATSSVLTITGGTGAVIGTGTTIQVAQAGASSSGYLSSTDWNTFNNKQNAITLTTTGTSGVATLVGATLNIPDYTEQYSGTVTSVATTAPITGGTITTTGTIGITQAGAASDGYLSSADWNTFNSKQGALTFTAPLVNTSGTITITQSGTATDGYLSSADWNTFNAKEPALTKGNLTEVTSAVLTITNGTNAVIGSGTSIQVAQSSSTTNGYLSSTDWTTFNSKASNSFTTITVATQSDIVADSATDTLTIAAGTGVSITTDANTDTLTISATGSGGTVTSISTTAPITGGPITGTGTIAITQSGAASDGYLSSTDWNTFNGKQNAITLTTTGTSGAATLIGSTLNIPQYTDQYVGTVTSVAALTLGTTGTDLSSTVANGTTTPVITLNVPTASATNRGALSSADWTTFNSKQSALTFTSPLVNTSNTITINQSSSTTDGYLSSTDWTTFNGKASNSFTTIAVAGQTSIVADSATDTLTVVAGTGISLTTNAGTDTLTITNTAATSIACFSGYSSTGVTLSTDGASYNLSLDTETIKDSSVFTHSTSTNPDEITVLVAGTYEISYSAAMINANATTNDAAVVNVYIYKNGSSLVSALNTVQNVAHLNTTNYNYYNQISNSYIVSLAVNDVIKLVALPSYLGGAGSSYGVIFGYLGNNNVTIKKLS